MQANGCSELNNGNANGNGIGNGTEHSKASTSNGVDLTNGTSKDLSKTDQDIVRLIGQHLRGLGFK